MSNLRQLDLNLLLTLDVLLTEHNVTRAAERLNLSQPAVSVQLSKLRETFNDPLLLPGPRGMRPTQRAEELRAPLRQALESLEQALTPAAPFDPAQAKQTWRIAASDYSASTTLLPLLADLRADAPHTRLAILEMNPTRIARQAERGEIDLAFHLASAAPAEMRCRILYREHYTLAGRVGHPQLKPKLTLKQYCRLEHVIVSPDGGGFRGDTDRLLTERGLTRRVALSVPHFLFMKSALTSTNLVAMLPSRLVRDDPALQTVKPPLNLPEWELAMLWHERSHRDPAHRWLRERIIAVV